jgi:hypothetical protein
MDFNLTAYGGAASLRVSERLLVGVGVSAQALQFSSVQDLGISEVRTLDSDSVALGLDIGALWRASRWTVGAAIRRGPQFDITESISNRSAVTTRTLSLPASLSVGVSGRPTPYTTVVFEYDRINYSSLTSAIDPIDPSIGRFEVNDASEFRGGFEFLRPVDALYQGLVVLRGGFRFEGDHRAQFIASPNAGSEALALEGIFGRGDHRLHFSAGAGVVLGSVAAVDFAWELSDVLGELSITMSLRF